MENELDDYRARAKKANSEGEYLAAFDIAREGLIRNPGDVPLLQRKALALARMGSTDQAEACLKEALAKEPDNIETLGIHARTIKDAWLRSGSPEYLKRALAAYEDVFNRSPRSYWMGINAATLALASRLGDKAQRLAGMVAEICESERAAVKSDEDRYWLLATLAEAALVRRKSEDALGYYAEAAKVGAGDPANLLATWRNARIILRFLDRSLYDRVRLALRTPTVAVLTEDCSADREYAGPVATQLRETFAARISELNVRFGYALADTPAGRLFAEAIRDDGGHMVPVSPDSALGFTGRQYSLDVMSGLAEMKTGQLGTQLVRLQLSHTTAGGPAVHAAEILSTQNERIVTLTVACPECAVPPAPNLDHLGISIEARAMMFADAKGFSGLDEAEMPAFVHDFLNMVAFVADQVPGPIYRNTWGDGLFFVFGKVADAGLFALRLAQQIENFPLPGTSKKLTLRIALHAGPVYRIVQNPITNREDYLGSHVNRTARMEPKALEGRVYVSEPFAALATKEAPGQFEFDYVGKVELPKSAGVVPIYDMRSAHASRSASAG